MIGEMSRAVAIMEEAEKELLSIARKDMERLLTRILEDLKMHAPVKTGNFRDSLMPYRGSVSSHESRRIRSHEEGGMTARAVALGWRPGQEIGVVSYVPYANRLADGWSSQQARGWIDLIIQNAAAEEESR